jgi:hypothetical protein
VGAVGSGDPRPTERCVRGSNPSFREILTEYIQEGIRARQAGVRASASAVEERLGLTNRETMAWHRTLTDFRLILMNAPRSAASSTYSLTSLGIEFAARLPSLEALVARNTARIMACAAPAEQKQRAASQLEKQFYRIAVSNGVYFTLQNARMIWNSFRVRFSDLPEY